MKFGVVTDGGMDGPDQPTYSERYARIIEEAKAAEESGFSVWGTSESHFLAPGLTISASDSLMGAVAASTNKIKLRYMALALPLSHPVVIAERLATIDVLSNGRAELATARGTDRPAFEAFNVSFAESRKMWAESLRIVSALLMDDAVSYEGEYWNINDVSVNPRPVQQPMPPILSVATSLTSHAAAAQQGLGVISWDGYLGWEYLSKCVANYTDGLAEAIPVAGRTNAMFSYYVTAACCMHDNSEAIQAVQPRADSFLESVLQSYSAVAQEPSYEYYAEIEKANRYHGDIQALMEHSPSVIAGDPDRFIAAFKALEELGVDEVVLSVDGMTHDAHIETIRMLGEHVIPKFE